jgi:hypothetical protein
VSIGTFSRHGVCNVPPVCPSLSSLNCPSRIDDRVKIIEGMIADSSRNAKRRDLLILNIPEISYEIMYGYNFNLESIQIKTSYDLICQDIDVRCKLFQIFVLSKLNSSC